jgi:ATP-binding cassette subfamily B (MDR/TAP) protein 1
MTQVGPLGQRFSGGQRQRIAIARAVIRQPSILIFDEATSALDTTSERAVQAALDRVAKNRTTIVIAHQLSTIMNADKIVVVAKGEIVQQGVHDHLLEDMDGPYWKLVNAQQLGTNSSRPGRDHFLESRTYSQINVKAEAEDDEDTLIDITSMAVGSKTQPAHQPPSSVLSSFWLLLSEQRQHWFGNIVMLLAAMGASGECYIQSAVPRFLPITTTSKQSFTSVPVRATDRVLRVLGGTTERIYQLPMHYASCHRNRLGPQLLYTWLVIQQHIGCK